MNLLNILKFDGIVISDCNYSKVYTPATPAFRKGVPFEGAFVFSATVVIESLTFGFEAGPANAKEPSQGF